MREFLAGFEENVVVEVDGLGPVRFCHGSPRSDEECVTPGDTGGASPRVQRRVPSE